MSDTAVPTATRVRPTVVELTQVAVGEPLRDGRRASRARVGLFSSFDKAQAWVAARRERVADEGYALLFYGADELVLDYAARVRGSRVYGPDGTLRGESSGGVERPWGGRDPATCRYKPGDLVGLVPNDAYRIGVILGLPPSPEEARRSSDVTLGDDLYLVGTVDEDDPLDPERYDHEHVPEGELFNPPHEIPEQLRQALFRRCLGYAGFPPRPEDDKVPETT
jgi:hypothetical protein